LIPVEQAACNALKAFLASEFPDAKVTGRWTAADKPLPDKAITILCVGPRKDREISRYVVKTVNTSPTAANVTFRTKACTQGVQLNVWATSGAVRDDLRARLDVSLNKGPFFTLGKGDLLRDGPLVALNPADGHEGFADFTFDGPMQPDTPTSIARNEFTSVIQGELAVILELTLTTPRLLRMNLQQHLTPNLQATDEYSLSSAGMKWTYTPAP